MAAKEIRFMPKRINLRKKRRQSTLIIFVIALLFVFALSTNVFAKVLNLGTPTDSVYVQGNLGIGTMNPINDLDIRGYKIDRYVLTTPDPIGVDPAYVLICRKASSCKFNGRIFGSRGSAGSTSRMFDVEIAIDTSSVYGDAVRLGSILSIDSNNINLVSLTYNLEDWYALKLSSNNFAGMGLGIDAYYTETDSNGLTVKRTVDVSNVVEIIQTVSRSIYSDSLGNVGISITNPTQKLHVAGVAQLDSISFGVTPGSGQTLALATVEYVNNSVSASGGLWSENGTNIYYNSGNVGVGTSAPAGNFDVANASSILLGGASATLRLTSTANTMWLQGLNATRNGTVNNITFSGYSGANRTLDIDLINQRVGIGTSAPAYNLDVTGTLRVTDAAYFDKTTFIKDSNGTVDSWWGWYAWDKEFQFNKRSSTNTFVQNIFTANWDTGNFNLVPTSGNVGVYRATPTAKLDVNGSFISTSATVSNLAGSGNTFVMSDNSGNLYTQDGITFKRTAIADASYNAQASDYIIAYTSLTADRTVTLPTSVCTSGRAYIIVNETGGAFNVVVDPESTATISGMTSISLPAYNSIPVYCNGTNWFIY